MDFGLAPSLWLILVAVGAAILGLALAYGTVMWRRRSRNPVVERAREDATKQLYERGEKDERKTAA